MGEAGRFLLFYYPVGSRGIQLRSTVRQQKLIMNVTFDFSIATIEVSPMTLPSFIRDSPLAHFKPSRGQQCPSILSTRSGATSATSFVPYYIAYITGTPSQAGEGVWVK